MRLAGNQNESEIGNSATRRCDWGGATRGSWVRGPIVGSWVRRSWVVGSPFVGSLFMGHGFAVRGLVGSWVRGFAVRGFNDLQLTISPVVQRSQLSGFAISLSLFACESLCVVSAELVRVCGESRAHGERRACACAW